MTFEFSLQTAIFCTLGSSLILAATFHYLWRLERPQRFLLFWSLAFFAQALRMCAQLGVTLGIDSLGVVADAFFALAAILIWRGCCELGAVRPRLPAVAAALAAALAWSAYGTAAALPFLARSIPLYLAAGGLLIHAGWVLFRLSGAQPETGYRGLALLFVLLGAHYIDYPLLRPLPWFAPIGFALAAILMLGIGIMMLIITQRRQQSQLRQLATTLRGEMAERQESESRYQTLVDELDEGIIVVDSELCVVTANPAAARMLAVPLDQLRRRPMYDNPYRLLRDEDSPLDPDDYPLHRALRQGHAAAGQILLLERADGSRRWLSIASRPLLRSGEQTPYAAIVSFYDISAQKAAERRLLASEIRFRSIFEGVANIAVQGYDRERRVIYWNNASERFFGYSRQEALGNSIDALIVDPRDQEAFRWDFNAWLAGGPPPASGEFTARRKDGSSIRIYSSQVMINNLAGEPEVYCIDLDFSDKHRLQSELQVSSERFRAIAESSALGVVVADEQGNFVYCNPRYLTLSASTQEEVRAGRWIEHLHPDDREPMRQHWREAIATQTGFTMERRVITGDGGILWARAHIVPIHSEQGVFRGFVAAVEDITALKEVERALRFSEAKYSGAFHASLDYVTLSDLETGEIYEVNEAFERLTGWTRAESIGHTATELGLWPDQATRSAMITRLREEGFLREYPFRVGTRDGRFVDSLLNASLITLDGRQYLLGVVRDITQQKEAEEALRRSEEKFSRIVHYSPVALAITDAATGAIVDVNRAWQELIGYTREQIIGHTSLEFGLWFDDAEREALYRKLEEGKGELDRYECRYRRADGSAIYGIISGRLFDIGGRSCYLWSVTDITPRHELEVRMAQLNAELEARVAARTAELQRAQDELIRAEKLAALGALVAGVAHELNTPIGNSVTVASTLHERTQEFAEQVNEGALRRSSLNAYLEAARTASDLLLRSLDQARNLVASFKQVAVDQTSDQRRKFDLREVVGEVLTTLSPTIRKTPFKVTMEIPAGIVLDSYPGPLGQVITNFVTNSLVHAFEGRQHGSIVVRAGVPEHGQVVMTVTDDGVGIAEEHFRHIFDPFFTTKLGQGGSGLGLHIVYNIVTRVLGGRISLDSQRGIGTTFMLTMPLCAPRAEPDKS
ncbi:MAG: PAS domain S-box protein [Rhodocyclales bacterium]|nr:PAS domain S-box protein [Rhodocyclales bacterium]